MDLLKHESVNKNNYSFRTIPTYMELHKSRGLKKEGQRRKAMGIYAWESHGTRGPEK